MERALEDGCVLGRIEHLLRYVYWRSGSRGYVVGVSGGIDSAVAVTMCCRAVGPERVLGLVLPSRVTDPSDIEDAREVCGNLGVECRVIDIEPVLSSFRALLGYRDDPRLLGNLMARTRMAILYYHANREGMLVCGTSNRTEYMIGYCTKWGDNAADVQPLLHLYKTEVIALAETMGNIPERVRRKAPTAGLWPGQTDEGEIGLSYPEIDAALRALAENGWVSRNPVEERVLSMVRASAHKREPPPSLL
ncbi:MAG: NAD+ synthase [Methanolinea sp.]|nr:NAD+ synthase [Methanolinea sp.]